MDSLRAEYEFSAAAPNQRNVSNNFRITKRSGKDEKTKSGGKKVSRRFYGRPLNTLPPPLNLFRRSSADNTLQNLLVTPSWMRVNVFSNYFVELIDVYLASVIAFRYCGRRRFIGANGRVGKYRLGTRLFSVHSYLVRRK